MALFPSVERWVRIEYPITLHEYVTIALEDGYPLIVPHNSLEKLIEE